MSKETTSLT